MILTILHRTKNAVRYKRASADSTWLLIGKTSAWADDANPPLPDPITDTTITSPVCAIKATVHLVAEDPSGTLLFRDSTGTIRKFLEYTTEADAITAGCRLVLVTAEVEGIDLNGLGVDAFRQLGFSTDLVPAVGHESDTFLPSSNVADWGDLENLHNRKPLTLEPESSWIASAIIEF